MHNAPDGYRPIAVLDESLEDKTIKHGTPICGLDAQFAHTLSVLFGIEYRPPNIRPEFRIRHLTQVDWITSWKSFRSCLGYKRY